MQSGQSEWHVLNSVMEKDGF